MLARNISFVNRRKGTCLNLTKRNYNMMSCIAVTSVASVSYLNLRSHSNLKERLAKNKATKSVIDDISYLKARMLGEDYVDIDGECNYINLKLASIGYNGPQLTVGQFENSKDKRSIENEELLTWLNDRYDLQAIYKAEAQINQNKKEWMQLICFVCGFIYCICLYTFYG